MFSLDLYPMAMLNLALWTSIARLAIIRTRRLARLTIAFGRGKGLEIAMGSFVEPSLQGEKSLAKMSCNMPW